MHLNIMTKTLALLAVAASLTTVAGCANQSHVNDNKNIDEWLVYIGTYTRGDSKGIYGYRMDLATGKLTSLGEPAPAVNPSFLAIHPTGQFLYSVTEVSDLNGKKSGGVNAFAIDRATGKLTHLNQQSSGGPGSCHVVVDPSGRNVLVANYGGGSIASLPIKPDGQVGPRTTFIQHTGSSVNPKRQSAPHAHSINTDPTHSRAVVADLGLDKVMIYQLDSTTGELSANDPPFAKVKPGGGPRHFAFHPSGRFGYVNNEMTSTVTAFNYDGSTGALTELHTLSTLPAGFEDRNSTAEIRVHPNGRFLYVSNRGHNSIAIFEINPSTGRLRALGHESTQGSTPRNFNLDPTGQYLLAANQATNTVVVFRVDPKTGLLKATGEKIEVPTPVCVRFVAPKK